MLKTLFAILILPLWTLTLTAQTPDVANCKDHELFTRFPKFFIQECSENYNEYEFVTGQDQVETIEGTLTEILYTYDGPFGPDLPSIFQVVKNYENAIGKLGGKKVFAHTKNDGYWTGATFQLNKDGNEYWVGIYKLINDPVDQYSFILLTKEGMKQEITAKEMFDSVIAGHTLSLYILFDTGLSAIKDESQHIVEELYLMLKNNPALIISIDGHTDNTGNSAANKTLSSQRATSVKEALVRKGIPAERLHTSGFGQDRPVADNDTADGKAKNRRVEIRRIQ